MEISPLSYKLRTLIINKDVIEKICAYTNGTYAYCVEKATRLHMHWYIQLEKSEEGLRKILRGAGLKGNSGYSLKQLQPDPDNPDCPFIGYLAYIIKDNNDIVHTLSDDVFRQAKVYDKQVKTGLIAKGEKKVWKKIINLISEELQKKGHKNIEYCFDGTGRSESYLTHKDISYYVVKYHVDNELLVRGHMLTSYVDTIWLYLQDSYSRHETNSKAHLNSYAEAVASNSVLIKYNDLKNRK